MVTILTIWEGDYGVPSVDIDSLILVTYVKIAKIQCTIKYGRNPLFCSMPKLQIHEGSATRELTGFQPIWDYFRGQIFDVDHFMSQEQKSESQAYFTYIQNSLLPGIYVTLWIDSQNYIETTRKWYRNALLFPINCWYTYTTLNRITKYVQVLTPVEDVETYSYKLVDEAKKCITDLSMKLGTKNYFFGSCPSSLDAVLYGFLAPLLNVPLPVPQLQTYLKDHENLVKFIKRINVSFFPQQKLEYKYVDKLQPEEDIQDLKTPPSTIAFAAFCAATAMISYGIINGIIKLP